jgi:hypothetical protein
MASKPKKPQGARGYFTDDAKTKILKDFMAGMSVKEIAKKYKDPVFGKPYMDELWDILREEARRQHGPF